ncbi:MAG: hypothetical protein K6G65_01445 [Lachnospiraceae bacterium]|nr:hypothetical protein [Lachnospiraceae bacterium]
MSKTKILIFQLKELIYTGIFIGLILLLVVLLFIMFRQDSDDTANISMNNASDHGTLYHAGTYNTTFSLGNSRVELSVTTDENHIKEIKLNQLDESVAAMYPLVTVVTEEINAQLQKGVDLNAITTAPENQYTKSVLVEAISNALEKATRDGN